MPKAKLQYRKIPKFENEDQERDFWASHDSPEFIDWVRAKRVNLPNLRPTTRAITIRLRVT